MLGIVGTNAGFISNDSLCTCSHAHQSGIDIRLGISQSLIICNVDVGNTHPVSRSHGVGVLHTQSECAVCHQSHQIVMGTSCSSSIGNTCTATNSISQQVCAGTQIVIHFQVEGSIVTIL